MTPSFQVHSVPKAFHANKNMVIANPSFGGSLQDMPANPFDVFSIPELLEQFAYHAKARRERAGKKA